MKPPKDDAEWARNTQRRIEQVENPASTRIGAWVLSTDPDTGNLIASNVNGGAVVLANQPEGEVEADAISSEYSAVKVERRRNQSGSGYVPIAWDTVAHSTPDWSVSEGSSEIAVPSDGLWLVTCHLQSPSTTGSTCKSRLNIGGTPVMSGWFTPYTATEVSIYMSEPFQMTAGTGVSLYGWLTGGANFTWGPSGSDPSVVTSLSLTRLPIG
ncbi:hypothetical protein [Rhodococcus pyridinivorans]|uniref:hypothetical protein n=1 Tax=Rhodococcus pyridinivorans TaxID=103816 RepID=UPI001D141C49|nr:hypothetical protein [Rhodococcus pyridinivorans]